MKDKDINEQIVDVCKFLIKLMIVGIITFFFTLGVLHYLLDETIAIDPDKTKGFKDETHYFVKFK